MTVYDVCIIGAGPSGLSTAIASSRLGVKTAIFEQHREVGTSEARCGGLVSPRCLEVLNLNSNGDYVVNRIWHLALHSPAGRVSMISLKPEGAVVLNRTLFERSLASKAIDLGVELYTGVRVRRIRFSNRFVEVETSEGVYRCEVVVDASGALTKFTPTILGFSFKAKKPLPTIQSVVKVERFEEQTAHVFLGHNVAPGFFGWLIPLGSSKARVGLACKLVDPAIFLKNLLKRVEARRVYSEARWFLLTGGPLARTYGERFISVGDAAGQCKPTTGGGIFTGTLCGLVAGLTLAEASRREVYARRMLSVYERGWRRLLEREFKVQLLLRKVFRRLTDGLLERALMLLDDSGLEDFDYLSRSLSRLIVRMGLNVLNPLTLRKLLTSKPDLGL